MITADANNVYWTSPSNGAVMEVPAGGGSTTSIVSGLGRTPFAITHDATYVYWSTQWYFQGYFAGDVSKAPVAGGAALGVVDDENYELVGVAVDGTNAYYGSYGTLGCAGFLKKVPLAGGAATTLASGCFIAQSIAVDATYVYWANGGVISKVPIAGGSVTTAVSEGAANIVLDGTTLYWSGATTIKKAPVGGGSSTTIASGLSSPNGIAVDSTNVYWVEASRIRKAPK